MNIQHDTIECPGGKAVKVTFTYSCTELAMIQADQPDQTVQDSFSFIARTVDGCYQPLRGLAITLTKADQPVAAFIIQSVYELHFGVSIQRDIDDAIHNPDRV